MILTSAMFSGNRFRPATGGPNLTPDFRFFIQARLPKPAFNHSWPPDGKPDKLSRFILGGRARSTHPNGTKSSSPAVTMQFMRTNKQQKSAKDTKTILLF
jgi:hypothetical protein